LLRDWLIEWLGDWQSSDHAIPQSPDNHQITKSPNHQIMSAPEYAIDRERFARSSASAGWPAA
jgi:hypothetical protein